MPVSETYGVMGFVDENGEQKIHYPITQAELALYDNGNSGLSADNAQDAIDEICGMIDGFKAAIIGGEVSANLATSDGVDLLESGSGEQLLAYRKLDMSETINAGVSVAMASAVGSIAAKLRKETAAAISAHNTSENSHAGYLAVSQ